MAFKNFVAIMSIMVSVPIAAFAVEPAVSVSCLADGGNIESFDFDLYATGHPMGGVTMFTGLFQVKGTGLVCGETSKGHLVTLPPKNGNLNFSGTLNCAQKQEFLLDVNTPLFHRGQIYEGTLAFRSISAFGPGPWTTQIVHCKQL
jgi:hypothetical protein